MIFRQFTSEYVEIRNMLGLGVELKEHNMSSLHRSPILHIIIIIIISYLFT